MYFTGRMVCLPDTCPLFKIINGKGFRIYISLYEITVKLLQIVCLLNVFNAFRNNSNMKFFCEINQTANDIFSFLIFYIQEKNSVKL